MGNGEMEVFELHNGCVLPSSGCLLTVQQMSWNCAVGVLFKCFGCFFTSTLFSNCLADVVLGSNGWVQCAQWMFDDCLANVLISSFERFDIIECMACCCPTVVLFLVPDLSSDCISTQASCCIRFLTVQGLSGVFMYTLMDVFSLAKRCHCPTDVLSLSVGCPRVV